ncbi:MAG: type VI secretion system ATPase TssH [Bryobacteraceae bacterium]|nr:type VI secretion system ATPase TssH [Bryobacteraceae bacterium]
MEVSLKFLVAKLNPVCRAAMEAAAANCFSRTNYEVEIEHLLLPLLDRPATDVARAVQFFAVDQSRLTRDLTQVLDRLKTGNSRSPALSPRISKLLTDAWTVASLEYSAGEIRSGFLLMALLGSGDLGRLVQESSAELLKFNLASLKQNWPANVAGSEEGGGTAAHPVPSTPGGTVPAAPTPALDQYTIDLTAAARAGKIDPILGRDTEIRQIVDILTRRRQNNPILTGEAGVGKTAIVEGLALRIVAGDVPPALRDVALRSLDLGLLQAGAGVRGEFENRLKSVIQEVATSARPIILFIDEAHVLIGAGGPAGQGDAANLLKPALARGELRTIAATTQAEYKRYFEKDAALTRRFQVVKVDEPSEEQAIHMMRAIVPVLEKHHGVHLLDEAVEAAVRLSHRYVTSRQLPDKAVNILDTASARVAIARAATPPILEDCQREIAMTEAEIRVLEREAVTGSDHGERLTQLRDALANAETRLADLEDRYKEERRLVGSVLELRRQAERLGVDSPDLAGVRAALDQANAQLSALQGSQPMMQVCVDRQTVAEVISTWTGVPVGRMLKDEIRTVLNLHHQLAERVVGQDHALEMISKRIYATRAGLDDPSRPTGVFLLAGPSGVGKTETALALADILYGGERNAVVINMSEYQEGHTVSSLRGSPPGYVGYGEGGILTEAVRRRPYTVVLLDEMEKAHADVMEIFYQVFDKGRMEDAEGREIDFRNTIILMTSNVGGDLLQRLCADPRRLPAPEDVVTAIGPALRQAFKPALLGRVVVVPYYPILDGTLKRIVELKLDRVRQRLLQTHRIGLTYSEDLVEEVARRCTEADSGARNVDNVLTNSLIPEISRQLLSRLGEREPVTSIHVSMTASGGLRYELA